MRGPALMCCLFLLLCQPLSAEEPLHVRIDQAAGMGTEQLPENLCSDEEFLRRVTLDLIGTIPSSEEARTFLKNESPDKRAQLIDQLLADPRHFQHLATQLSVMLLERRKDKYIPAAEWEGWLRNAVAENKPFDELVRTMLTADGTEPETRPAASFLLSRDLDANETTRDIGRILLGRDMECAQCHDHPIIGDYLQRHYYGLNAFLSRTYVFNDKKEKKAFIGEKAEGKVTFTSVFTNESGETAPRLLDFPEIADPMTEGEPYINKPDGNTRGVPQYSRRLLLADAITAPANQDFSRNFANRIWKMMLGRGFVEPVDMWYSGNPPAHPEVLAVLTAELQSQGYNLQHLLREISLSKVYQQSSQLPTGVEEVPETSLAVATLKPLTPEQLAWATMQATASVEITWKSIADKEQKANPDTAAETLANPAWREQQLRAALAGPVNSFVGTFDDAGSLSGGFDATVNQVLFLANGSLLQGWLAPRTGSLTQRLLEQSDPQLLAEELYLSVLTRTPTPEEIQDVTAYLTTENLDRTVAVQELIWALIASAEFRLNH